MSQITLTLIRGLPGSGKSTFAKTIDANHIEADMYFTDENGNYQFDGALLKEAHSWCKEQCEIRLQQGKSVVISNTFVKQWEMDAYRLLAKKHHATLSIVTCMGQFENEHNIPPATLQKMKREWQP